MNPFGYHYPAGAEHDPRAPWNQREISPCSECRGEGESPCEVCKGMGVDGMCPNCEHGTVKCGHCDGTGDEPPPDRDDW